MSKHEVADEIFPLKELRVRGEIHNTRQLFEDNAVAIEKHMLSLRESFGTLTFGISGAKTLLELWRSHDSQGSTPKQLRWCIHLDSSAYNRIFITVPIVKALTKRSRNSQRIAQTLKHVADMPSFQTLLGVEKKRVGLNAQSKFNHRILLSLDEMQQAQDLTQVLKDFL